MAFDAMTAGFDLSRLMIDAGYLPDYSLTFFGCIHIGIAWRKLPTGPDHVRAEGQLADEEVHVRQCAGGHGAQLRLCGFPAASADRAPVLRALSHIQPGGPIAVAGGGPRLRGSGLYSTQNVVSDNWGGYAALRSGTRFRFIRAMFFVPYVNCANTPSSFSGHWVGLDGLGNSTVEQDGLLAACNGAVPEYAVWYEMFPEPPVYQNVTVTPGDSIVASVYYNAKPNTFTLSVADTTNGQHFTVTKPCPDGSTCSRTSVEAISEAPSNGSSILPLTDFNAESYSSIKVTNRAGQRGGLRSSHWDTLKITTENSNGDVLDQPTQIFRGVAFPDVLDAHELTAAHPRRRSQTRLRWWARGR